MSHSSISASSITAWYNLYVGKTKCSQDVEAKIDEILETLAGEVVSKETILEKLIEIQEIVDAARPDQATIQPMPYIEPKPMNPPITYPTDRTWPRVQPYWMNCNN